MMQEDKLSKIVALCARRGFVFPSCEIYGRLASIWDYGPLGAQLKKNIKDIWWDTYVQKRDDVLGLDSSLIMSEDVFKASGHLSGFTDTLVDCKGCKKRFKIEMLQTNTDGSSVCPECGGVIDLACSPARKFNLMLKTFLGVVEEESQVVYLRPETAQGIFVNFTNILDTMHKKLPFGVAQIGKSFRNEVTTKSFIFRTREFEQMEIEYFVDPENADSFYEQWRQERFGWYTSQLGIRRENLRLRDHRPDELAHYAKACVDIEYNFPFGWKELEGVAHRGDFDLKQHQSFSKKDLAYFDDKQNKKFIPYVIEPSAGVDRTFLALVSDAYAEEEVQGKTRVVLRFDKRVSPYKIAVFPLLKNRPEIVEKAKNIQSDLKRFWKAIYDDTAAIGKLYRRQDEIGTPFCVTVDVESLSDGKVTVRDRDTMIQERISCECLSECFRKKLQ